KVLYDVALSFEQHGYSQASGIPGRVTITLGIPQVLITPVLIEFADKFPYTELEIHAAMDTEPSQIVRSGAASMAIALARSEYDEDLRFRLLGRVVMSHVVHYSHPLASQEQVS